MKRIPLISSFILFLALCATVAYWAMQFMQPPPRAIVAPPPVVVTAPELSAAATLLGGGHGTAASNFQLTGIILADHANESVAIISVDGKPAKPLRVNAEILPGISVQEIQRDAVLLSDHGASKRLDLPVNAQGKTNISPAPLAATMPSNIAPALAAPPPSATGSGGGAFTQSNHAF